MKEVSAKQKVVDRKEAQRKKRLAFRRGLLAAIEDQQFVIEGPFEKGHECGSSLLPIIQCMEDQFMREEE